MIFDYLVGGLEHFLSFHILGRIIPSDEQKYFFGGVGLNHQPVILCEEPSSYETSPCRCVSSSACARTCNMEHLAPVLSASSSGDQDDSLVDLFRSCLSDISTENGHSQVTVWTLWNWKFEMIGWCVMILLFIHVIYSWLFLYTSWNCHEITIHGASISSAWCKAQL